MDEKTTAENPVTHVRKQLGISRATLAQRTGCSYGMLSHSELGYDPNLPPSVLDALAQEGVPVEEAERMYSEWRSERAKQLRGS